MAESTTINHKLQVFFQKIPLNKSFRTVFDFDIQHINMDQLPNVLKKIFAPFMKRRRTADGLSEFTPSVVLNSTQKMAIFSDRDLETFFPANKCFLQSQKTMLRTFQGTFLLRRTKKEAHKKVCKIVLDLRKNIRLENGIQNFLAKGGGEKRKKTKKLLRERKSFGDQCRLSFSKCVLQKSTRVRVRLIRSEFRENLAIQRSSLVSYFFGGECNANKKEPKFKYN